MKELAGVILIGIFVAAWMTRWEVIAGSGTNGTGSIIHFKLNRLTGTHYWCSTECQEVRSAND